MSDLVFVSTAYGLSAIVLGAWFVIMLRKLRRLRGVALDADVSSGGVDATRLGGGHEPHASTPLGEVRDA